MPGRPVLGFDLGTTYSCVARLNEHGRPEVLPNRDGELTTPSVVFFDEDGSVVVGETAKNELRRQPGRVVDLVKRHMGEEGYAREYDGTTYSPQAISALILRHLVKDALTSAGELVQEEGTVADVVITVPAYFGAAERQATLDAGRMAGLEVLHIINEPTAAALAYKVPEDAETSTVLVYDLGGGTFDVTVIQVTQDEIRVLATDGDHQLGGADWDAILQEQLVAKFAAVHQDKDFYDDDLAAGDLAVLSEETKKRLSQRSSYRTSLTAHGERAAVEVTRDEYEKGTADLVERTMDFTRSILETAAAKQVETFDAVLLVGGMSKSPAIAQRLAETFPQLPPARLTDPDQIVAKGAALYAAHVYLERHDHDPDRATGESDTARPPALPAPRIVNVSSKGYGIRAVRGPDDTVGHIAWLIEPNDPVPVTKQKIFGTVHHGQTEVEVEVHESPTTHLVEDPARNKLLITGRLVDLPPGQPPGKHPVTVDFALGDDGILRISARGDNGAELTLEARITGATSPEELARPLPRIQG